MKNRRFRKLITLILALSLLAGFANPVAKSEPAKAAKTPYGKTLKKLTKKKLKIGATKVFNSTLKERTKMYNSKGKLVAGGFYKKPQKVNVKMTVTTSKIMRYKTKNKVLFKCKLEYKNNPAIQATSLHSYFSDSAGSMYVPFGAYTVFDYATGKSLENKKNAKKVGVVSKKKKWKRTYYPKQHFQMSWGEDTKKYDNWIRNLKEETFSFTVTYPKNYKNVVVGVGSSAAVNAGFWGASRYNHWDFWDDADNKWGKSDFYKKGNFAYIRLPG